MRAEYAEMVKGPGRFEGEGPMTAYVHQLMLEGGEDDSTGDSDYGWASIFGKRILWGTSTGFLTLVKYRTVDAARSEFDAFDNEFGKEEG